VLRASCSRWASTPIRSSRRRSWFTCSGIRQPPAPCRCQRAARVVSQSMTGGSTGNRGSSRSTRRSTRSSRATRRGSKKQLLFMRARRGPPLTKQVFHGLLQRFGPGGGSKALDVRAIRADQELGEVPLDALAAQQAGRTPLELGEQRMCVRAIHFQLAEQGEADAEADRAEIGDFAVTARLLGTELVAGKAQHHQPSLPVVLPETLKPFVWRREAAAAGGIGGQQRAGVVNGRPHLPVVHGGQRDLRQICHAKLPPVVQVASVLGTRRSHGELMQ